MVQLHWCSFILFKIILCVPYCFLPSDIAMLLIGRGDGVKNRQGGKRYNSVKARLESLEPVIGDVITLASNAMCHCRCMLKSKWFLRPDNVDVRICSQLYHEALMTANLCRSGLRTQSFNSSILVQCNKTVWMVFVVGVVHYRFLTFLFRFVFLLAFLVSVFHWTVGWI